MDAIEVELTNPQDQSATLPGRYDIRDTAYSFIRIAFHHFFTRRKSAAASEITVSGSATAKYRQKVPVSAETSSVMLKKLETNDMGTKSTAR